jgi:hypothetical protein
MEERQIAAGTAIYFGRPAKPMPEARASAIAAAVARVPGIVEAHLPQCYIEGDAGARQVLVVVVDLPQDIPRIAQAVLGELAAILPPGDSVDLLPFDRRSLPRGVREAGCRVFGEAKKPWWKLWG